MGLAFREHGGLLLAQNAVYAPTTFDVFTRLTAMLENVGVIAASIFQGIGKDGQLV